MFLSFSNNFSVAIQQIFKKSKNLAMKINISAQNLSVNYTVRSPNDFNLKHYLLDRKSKSRIEPQTICALRNLSLELTEGDRLGVLGDNGAGKSTLLSLLAGVLQPDSGQLVTNGQVLGLLNDPLANLVPEASGLENIIQILILLDHSEMIDSSLVEEIVDFSGLSNRIFDPVFSYSTGMRVRLKMSIILSLEPEILIMDEGFGFADQKFYSKAQKSIESFMSNSKIVVVSSHQVSYLHKFCNKGLILDRGECIFIGNIDEALDIRMKMLNEELDS